MAEVRSALAAVWRPGRHGAQDGPPGLRIGEILDRDLVQLSTFSIAIEAWLEAYLGAAPPTRFGLAVEGAAHAAFLIAPDRYWITGPRGGPAPAPPAGTAVVTELGHSRTILRLDGPAVRAVLAKGLAVDLEDGVFPPGAFCQSTIHHVAVMVHRRADGDAFDLYIPRGYAQTLFEWLGEAAAEFGMLILDA